METYNAFEANIFLKPLSGNDREKGGHLKITAQTTHEMLQYLEDENIKKILGKIELLHAPTSVGGNPIVQQVSHQTQQQAPVVPFEQCAHVNTFPIKSKPGVNPPWSMRKCKDCGGVKFDGLDRKGQPNVWLPPKA